MGTKWPLLACLASTLYMTGLIVFVHRVHYPLFGRVEPSAFRAYHAEHTRLTTQVVALPMLVELVASLWLVALRPGGLDGRLAWAGLGAAALSWLATGLLSVPLHERLAHGFDPEAHRRLVATNWVRMVSWPAHAAIALAMTARALR